MRHKLLIIIICCMCLPSITYSQDNMPIRDVELVDDGVIVTYRFNGAKYRKAPFSPDAYFWEIPGFAQNAEEEEPAILLRWDTFAVPDNANVTLQIVNAQYKDSVFVLSPSVPPSLISQTVPAIAISPIKYYDGFFPNSFVEVANYQYYRSQKLVNIRIAPIQYDMIHNVVRAYTFIQFKLTFINKDGEGINGQVCYNDKKNIIGVTDEFLGNIALNYFREDKNANIQNTKLHRESIKDDRSYLIITTNDMLSAANQLATWKRTKGFRVFVESKEIWQTTDSIKNIISQHYNQHSIMYVLLIGGINEIPADIIDFEYFYNGNINNFSHATDLYYSFMDNDQTVDVYIGRIPATTLEEANTVVNKIIQYEKKPTLSESFYNTALHCAYFEDILKWGINSQGNYTWISGKDSIEDRLFTVTSELIKGYVEQQGKTINRVYNTLSSVYPMRWTNRYSVNAPVDYPIRYFSGDTIPEYLQKNPLDSTRVNWDGDATNIINFINDGVFYILHRDHGNESGWDKPEFKTNNISSLQNGNKLPIVFSLNCLTGSYNINSNCFAKQFLTKANGGCVGIFAATRESFSPINDRLAISMFNAIWPTPSSQNLPSYELAKILNYGMIYAEYSHDRYYQYTREIFHCFGDPSLKIYTNTPENFLNPSIEIVGDNIVVETQEDSVRISFYYPNSQHVDSYVGNYVEYPLYEDGVVVCLDKHNYVPYTITCGRNIFIQNESITEPRYYKGQNIYMGHFVTSLKPNGDVIIQGADIKVKGENVNLQPGVTIMNSNFEIQVNQ